MSEERYAEPISDNFFKSQSLNSRNPGDNPSKIAFKGAEAQEDDAEAMAKDTGLLWIYDGASPVGEKQDIFTSPADGSFSQAQYSTFQSNNYNESDPGMGDMGFSQHKGHNFSSNSLQNYNNITTLKAPPPRYHGASSQVVN